MNPQDDQFFSFFAPGLSRRDNPQIQWGHIPETKFDEQGRVVSEHWVRREVERYNVARLAEHSSNRAELVPSVDEFGNPITRLNLFRDLGRERGVQRPQSFELFYDPRSDQVAVTRRGSSNLHFFVGSAQVKSSSEDNMEVLPLISREQNFSTFLLERWGMVRREDWEWHNRGLAFAKYDANALTPPILRSLQGAFALPQTTTYPGGDRMRVRSIMHEDRMRILGQVRSESPENELIFSRDNMAMHISNYRDAPWPGNQGVGSVKDWRRQFRGANSVMDRVTQPRPIATSYAFFKGEAPHTGTPMINTFIDDPLLFSEGGALVIAGQSWVGSPKQFAIPKSRGLPREAVEQMGFRVGNIYGKEYPGSMPSGFTFVSGIKNLGPYDLGNATLTAVMGMVETDEGWTASLLPMGRMETAELKSFPGLKRLAGGATREHQLFKLTESEGLDSEIISAMPQKPERLLDTAMAGFKSHEEGAEGIYRDFIATAMKHGIREEDAMKMFTRHRRIERGRTITTGIEFDQDNPYTMPLFAAASLDYMRRHSGKIQGDMVVSTWALEQLKRRMGDEAFRERYGEPDMSGPTTTLKNHEMFQTTMPILENPLRVSTTGKTKLSTHRLNLLARNQPLVYNELLDRDRRGEFHNSALPFIRATLANVGMGVENPAIDLETAVDFQEIRKQALRRTGGDMSTYVNEMAKILGEQFPNRYLSYRGVQLPPARYLMPLLSKLELNEKGVPYGDGLGQTAHQLFRAIGEGEEMDPSIISENLMVYSSQEKVQKNSRSIIAKAFTGKFTASPLLPNHVAVANEADILKYIEGMKVSNKVKERMRRDLAAGKGVSGLPNMQESNEFSATPAVQLITPEQATQKYKGMEGIKIPSGEILGSVWLAALLDKDADGDQISMMITSVPANKLDFERQNEMFMPRGKEALSLLSKIEKIGGAERILGGNHFELLRGLLKDPLESRSSFDDGSYASEQMQMTWGPFVEAGGALAWELGTRLGVAHSLHKPTSIVGNQIYQLAMDMKPTRSAAAKWIQEFYQRFAMGAATDKNKPNMAMSFFKGANKRGEESVFGRSILTGDVTTIALRMFDRSIHMEIGSNENPGADREQYFGKDLMKGYAHYLAPLLGPMGQVENKERVSAIQKALEDNYNTLGGKDPGLMRDARGMVSVLQAITGESYSEKDIEQFIALTEKTNLVGYKEGSYNYRKGNNPLADTIVNLMLGSSGDLSQTSFLGAFLTGSGMSNTLRSWHRNPNIENKQGFDISIAEEVGGIMNAVNTGISWRRGRNLNSKAIPQILSGQLAASMPADIYMAERTTRSEGLIGINSLMKGLLGVLKGEDPGFKKGGYTGHGDDDQPAGIVHAGEYVLTQDEVRRIREGRGEGVYGKIERDLNMVRSGPKPSMSVVPGYKYGGEVSPFYHSILERMEQVVPEISMVNFFEGEKFSYISGKEGPRIQLVPPKNLKRGIEKSSYTVRNQVAAAFGVSAKDITPEMWATWALSHEVGHFVDFTENPDTVQESQRRVKNYNADRKRTSLGYRFLPHEAKADGMANVILAQMQFEATFGAEPDVRPDVDPFTGEIHPPSVEPPPFSDVDMAWLEANQAGQQVQREVFTPPTPEEQAEARRASQVDITDPDFHWKRTVAAHHRRLERIAPGLKGPNAQPVSAAGPVPSSGAVQPPAPPPPQEPPAPPSQPPPGRRNWFPPGDDSTHFFGRMPGGKFSGRLGTEEEAEEFLAPTPSDRERAQSGLSNLRRYDQEDITNAATDVRNWMGLSHEERTGRSAREAEEIRRHAGTLKAFSAEVGAVYGGGLGRQIPQSLRDVTAEAAGALALYQQEGGKATMPLAAEDADRKAAEARRLGGAQMRMSDIEALTAETIPKLIGQFKELDTVTQGVIKGNDYYLKQANQTLDVFDKWSNALKNADEALANVGGDRNLLTDRNLRRVLDVADQQPEGGQTVRQRMAELEGGAVSNLRGAVAQQVAERALNPWADEENRQMELTRRMMQGGRIGTIRRGELPDEAFEGGWDTGLPGLGRIRGRRAITAAAGAARVTSGLTNAMWAFTHANWWISEPMQQHMAAYQESELTRQGILAQTGGLTAEDMNRGIYGDVMRTQGRAALYQRALGEQIYTAYGAAGGAGSSTLGRAAGSAIAIGGPALAGAMFASQLLPSTPVAGPIVGGLVGALAFGNYVNQFANSDQASSSYLRDVLQARSQGAGSFLLTTIGNFPSTLGLVQQWTADSERFYENRDVASIYNALRSDYFNTRPAESFQNPGTFAGGSTGAPQLASVAQQRQHLYNTFPDIERGRINSEFYTAFVDSMTADYGVSDQIANSLYFWNERFNQNWGQHDPFFQQQLGIAQVGGDFASATTAVVQSMGFSPFNTAAQERYGRQVADQISQLPPEEQMLRLESITGTAQRFTDINQLRMMAGMNAIETTGTDPFSNRPELQLLRDQMLRIQASTMLTNPQFSLASGPEGGNFATDLQDRANALLRRGDTPRVNEILSGYQFGESLYNRYSAYAPALDVGTNLYQLQNLNLQQQDQTRQVLSGNRFMTTQLLGRQDRAFNLVDLDTGASVYEFGIDNRDYADLQDAASAYGLSSLLMPQADIAGGRAGIIPLLEGIQRQQSSIRFSTQRDLSQMQYGIQSGGMLGLDGRGFTIGGSLSATQQMLSNYGINFNAGNGMGLWQIEDAMTMLGREQRDWSIQQSGQQLQLQRQQFALSGSQFTENMGLQQRRLDFSTNQQQWQMETSRSQELTRQQWQLEDLAFNRNATNLSFGWQMEDFDRNIRFARGREKRDLMREQERAVVRHAMQSSQTERQEDRVRTQFGWSEEQFNKQKEYFDQNKQFQQEQLDLQKRHHEQSRALDQQRMNMAEQNHAKEIQWLTESQALEDQQRLIQRQWYSAQEQIAQNLNQQMFDLSMRAQNLNTQLQIMNLAEQNKSNAYQVSIERLTVLNPLLNQFLNNLNSVSTTTGRVTANSQTAAGWPGSGSGGSKGTSSGGSAGTAPSNPQVGQKWTDATGKQWVWSGRAWAPTSASGPGGGGAQPTPYASGGFTGRGSKNDIAGVVHRGEYVIPQEGVPVISGNSETDARIVSLLETMVQLLQGIKNNPTMFQAVVNGTPTQAKPITPHRKAIATLP